MFDEALRKLMNFIQVNRPHWKFIIEGDIVRMATGQFVVSWDVIRQIEDLGDFTVFEVIDHSTMGQIICFKPQANKA